MNDSTEFHVGDDIGQAINFLAVQFTHSSNPRLDAQVLLAHVVGKPRAWVVAHPDSSLTQSQKLKISQAALQINHGVPLPYVLGHWEFYGLDFNIKPPVLIPRPETEIIVDKSIKWLRDHPELRQAADIGTGSGCIAISLAVHVPDLQITAVDISAPALTIARDNAAKHMVANQITFIQADLFNQKSPSTPQIPDSFHLIAANLPYIPTKRLHGLDVYGREPTLALDGGQDGLSLIRKFLFMAGRFLSSGGIMLVEIDEKQGRSALELAEIYFKDAKSCLYKDFSGFDRVLSIQT